MKIIFNHLFPSTHFELNFTFYFIYFTFMQHREGAFPWNYRWQNPKFGQWKIKMSQFKDSLEKNLWIVLYNRVKEKRKYQNHLANEIVHPETGPSIHISFHSTSPALFVLTNATCTLIETAMQHAAWKWVSENPVCSPALLYYIQTSMAWNLEFIYIHVVNVWESIYRKKEYLGNHE